MLSGSLRIWVFAPWELPEPALQEGMGWDRGWCEGKRASKTAATICDSGVEQRGPRVSEVKPLSEETGEQ